jgi:hypothetical protein
LNGIKWEVVHLVSSLSLSEFQIPSSYWESPQIIMADDIYLLCQNHNNTVQGWEKLSQPAWFGRETILKRLSGIPAFHINIEPHIDCLSGFFRLIKSHFTYKKITFFFCKAMYYFSNN